MWFREVYGNIYWVRKIGTVLHAGVPESQTLRFIYWDERRDLKGRYSR
jgi:hypothetical protein